METDYWQHVYYVVSSMAMVVFMVMSVLFFWAISYVLKLLKKVSEISDAGSRVISEIVDFRRDLKLGALRFLLKIIEKGDKNE